MTGFILFGPDDRVIKVSDDLRARLGYAIGEPLPVTLQAYLVEKPTSIASGGGAASKSLGSLRLRTGETLEVTMRCERVGEGGLSVLEVDADEGPKLLAKSADGPSLDFLTTISHELRVSLNGVIGFANLLGISKLNREQKELLTKMQSCNFLLKGLINDILEYSQVVSSKVGLSSERVELGDFIRDVVGLFNDRCRRKGLELRLELDPSVESEVALAKLRVTQVLSNLIANAIKFTDAGWVRVGARVAGGLIRFEVADSGRGISDDEVGKIFQPFVQAASRGVAHEGSGLGLAISRSLAERMGGRLALERPSEGGSVFTFTLPLLAGSDVAQEEPQGVVQSNVTPPARPAAEKGPRHVLIVEDNELNAEILGHFLRDYGVTYEVVANGRAAVESYQDHKHDLILMDVMLPEMDGYEATQRILAGSNRKPAVPIVGVTAKAYRRDQMRCLDVGMVEVVHKPVDFSSLRMTLDKHLYGSRTSDEPRSASAPDPAPRPLARGALDSAVLESYIERMSSNESDRDEIVKSAVGVIDKEVERLLVAIERSEREETAMRAHSLKGALALLGASNVLDLAKGLELMASKTGEEVRPKHWQALVQDAYTEFKDALDAYMSLGRDEAET